MIGHACFNVAVVPGFRPVSWLSPSQKERAREREREREHPVVDTYNLFDSWETHEGFHAHSKPRKVSGPWWPGDPTSPPTPCGQMQI